MPTTEVFCYTATTSWYTWLNYIHKYTDIQDTCFLALWRVLHVFCKGDWVECHDTGELYAGNFSQDDGKLRRVNCFFFSYMEYWVKQHTCPNPLIKAGRTDIKNSNHFPLGGLNGLALALANQMLEKQYLWLLAAGLVFLPWQYSVTQVYSTWRAPSQR